MNPAKVVMHVEQRHGVHVVCQRFAECIRKASKTAHTHPHAEVLCFNKTRADVFRIRRTRYFHMSGAKTLRGAVPFVTFRIVPVHLHQLRVINLVANASETAFRYIL
jgi:hypothetical protein